MKSLFCWTQVYQTETFVKMQLTVSVLKKSNLKQISREIIKSRVVDVRRVLVVWKV